MFGLFGMQLLVLRALLCLLVGAIPIVYIRYKRSKRLGKFEDQLPDAIDLFNRVKVGSPVVVLAPGSGDSPTNPRIAFTGGRDG